MGFLAKAREMFRAPTANDLPIAATINHDASTLAPEWMHYHGQNYVLVTEEDARCIAEWWRSANEAPGGCRPHEAFQGMKDSVMRMEYSRRKINGK